MKIDWKDEELVIKSSNAETPVGWLTADWEAMDNKYYAMLNLKDSHCMLEKEGFDTLKDAQIALHREYRDFIQKIRDSLDEELKRIDGA